MPNYRNYNRYTRYHELYEADKSDDAPKTLTQRWVQSNGLLDAKNIVIPDGVTSLGEECFYDREYLENVKIPSGVTSIGNSCFAYCSSLKNIKLPNSVTSLGDKCFYSCSSLKAITIPGSVKRIGKSAFRNCTSLTDVYYGGTEKDVQKIKIDSSETTLLGATWHYNSKGVNERFYSNRRTSRHCIRESYKGHRRPLREAWDGKGILVYSNYIDDFDIDETFAWLYDDGDNEEQLNNATEYEKSEAVWDWLNDEVTWDTYTDDLRKMLDYSHLLCFAQSRTCLPWTTGDDVDVVEDWDELMNLLQDCDYRRFVVNGGALEITGTHHDGTVHIYVKELTGDGEDAWRTWQGEFGDERELSGRERQIYHMSSNEICKFLTSNSKYTKKMVYDGIRM